MIYRKSYIVCTILLLAVFLSACGLFSRKKNTQPEPTHVLINFEAAGYINPNDDDLSSPLKIRIYPLRSDSTFDKADFLSLYEKDGEVLGSELVGKPTIFVLMPNEKEFIHLKPTDDTHAIGILGEFFNYKQAQSKSTARIRTNATTEINIYVSGINLTRR